MGTCFLCSGELRPQQQGLPHSLVSCWARCDTQQRREQRMCAYHINITSSAFTQHSICLQYTHVCLRVPRYFVAGEKEHTAVPGTVWEKLCQHWTFPFPWHYPVATWRSLLTPRLGRWKTPTTEMELGHATPMNGAGHWNHLNDAYFQPTADHTSHDSHDHPAFRSNQSPLGRPLILEDLSPSNFPRPEE